MVPSRVRVGFVAFVALLGAACAACAPSRPAMDERARTDASQRIAEPQLSGGLDASTNDASVALGLTVDGGDGGRPAAAASAMAEPCVPLRWSAACTPQRRTSEAADVDTDAWYAARSAALPRDSIAPTCVSLRIGPAAEEALACSTLEHTGLGDPARGPHAYRVLLRTVIRAVRKKRVEVVFDVPYYVDLLDKDEPSSPLFTVVVDTSRSSTEIVVSEPGPGACAQAARTLADEMKAASKEKDRAARAAFEIWPRLDTRLLGQICAATGRYVWSNGAFRRLVPVPPALTPGASSL